MLCPKCGAQNEEDKKFCGNCGTQLLEQEVVNDAVTAHNVEAADHPEPTVGAQEILPDSFNSTVAESTEQVPNKDRPNNKKILVIAGVVLALVVIGGASAIVLSQNRSAVADNPKKTTTPAVSTAVQENSAGDSAEEMKKYNAMSVETFDELPRAERVKYALYVMKSQVSLDLYKMFYTKNAKARDSVIKPVPVSVDNTGQDILNQGIYAVEMANTQSLNEEEDTRGVEESQKINTLYDLSDGHKILSAVYYSVGKNKPVTKAYLQDKAFQEALVEPTAMLNNQLPCINTSELIAGKDSSTGETVQYKIVTFNTQKAETLYAKYVFIKIKNTEEAVWLLDSQADTIEELGSLGLIR